MNSYFARHEVDKKGEGWGVDSAGYIAWLLWGGDAGRSWARGISNREEAKEKSTMNDLTTAYFEIIKADKRDDGTLMVYGKATDDSLDIDQQICDPLWLDRAMPEWFKSGGNIREQHSSIAAGVAKEYEKKADGHYIHALVVDPISVKKVDNGVLKGFSIGIKSPRVVRDQKAANGRIIDGQIVEVSLVDRPANPNCQLVLAKSVEGESGMWKTEELIEKEQEREANGRFGGSTSPKDESGGNENRNDAEVLNAASDVTDITDSVDDLQTELLNAGDMEGAEACAEAHDALIEAHNNLSEAAQDKSDNAHAINVDEAASRLQNARDSLSDVNHGDADDFSDQMGEVISQLESYLDDFHGRDKKITGDLNKEQEREANGRFGGSTGGKEETSTKVKVSEIKSGNFFEAELKSGEVIRGVATTNARPSHDFDTGKTESAFKYTPEVSSRVGNQNESPRTMISSRVASIRVIRQKSIVADLNKSTSIALQLSEIEDLAEKRALLMKNAQEIVELSKSIAPADIVKFDQKLYDDARRALAQLIVVEANEMDTEDSNEEMSIAHLLSAVHHLFAWYQGEEAEGEVMDPMTEDIEMAAAPEDKPEEETPAAPMRGKCMDCGKRAKMCKCDGGFKAADDKKKSAETHKCLECGCGVPQDSHGREDVTTAEMVTQPKSAEVTELEDQELPVAEEKVSEESNLSEEIEAIVEKAIKSATESLKSEIAELANANKAAVEKAVGLESELAVTKSLAVAGGPKRTIKPIDHSTNDLLVKAATYKAKADATTDPDLMKGYALLSKQYFAEAETLNKSN
jgi:hypothetical protein